MEVVSGSCLCGQITFVVEGGFDSFYLCHCKYCQKDTGSAHGANLFSGSARLIWKSGAEAVSEFTLQGTRHRKCFCRQCGSALPDFQTDIGMLVVPAGSLDVPVNIKPTANIFMSSCAEWEVAAVTAQNFKEFPA